MDYLRVEELAARYICLRKKCAEPEIQETERDRMLPSWSILLDCKDRVNISARHVPAPLLSFTVSTARAILVLHRLGKLMD